MNDADELQALTNAPCIIEDDNGTEFKCSFPTIEGLVTLQGKAKTQLLSATREIALAMSESGASQELVDKVWIDYQSADEKTSLNNCLVDPDMFKDLVKSCLIKNHPDIEDKKIKELLTVPNLAKITSYFSILESVIKLNKDTTEKN